MPMTNSDIAEAFTRIADLLEIKGANQFRVRAYRGAARTIGGLYRDVRDMLDEDEDLSELPGIGQDLAEKTAKLIASGHIPVLDKLEQQIPKTLTELLKIPTLGPKRVRALYKELNIESLHDLKRAIEEDKIKSLRGFGKKTKQRIIKEMKRMERTPVRTALLVAEQIATPLLDHLKQGKQVKKIRIAGSFRRRKETVGDLDILVTAKRNANIMKRFVQYEDIDRIISKGKTRFTVILRSGLQVDVRVVAQVSYGAAMIYFTGSKAHNIALRKRGQRQNLKINEYGVYKGKKRIAGRTEEKVYETLGLAYISPELRENSGEIEAADNDDLPDLISTKDMKGDMHTHTKETDGHNSLEEMVDAARKKGYAYIANTEHSKHVSIARGLNTTRVRRQIKKINKMNSTLRKFKVLKSIEVDILENGTLDLPDDILKELDFTVCAIHYKFNLSKEKQTRRVLQAMENPYFNIFAHPTGRLLGERSPYAIDLERIMEQAIDYDCVLELNGHPERLDLNDHYCQMAKDLGVKISISTDAHSTNDLDYMRFGVGQARRGWLEPKDVVNTRDYAKLIKMLNRK